MHHRVNYPDAERPTGLHRPGLEHWRPRLDANPRDRGAELRRHPRRTPIFLLSQRARGRTATSMVLERSRRSGNLPDAATVTSHTDADRARLRTKKNDPEGPAYP